MVPCFLVAQLVKNLPAMQETWLQSLGYLHYTYPNPEHFSETRTNSTNFHFQGYKTELLQPDTSDRSERQYLLITVSLLNYVFIIVSALNHKTQKPNLRLPYLWLELLVPCIEVVTTSLHTCRIKLLLK